MIKKSEHFFFFFLLLFLPTQLGLHFWPDWAFVLGRRVDYLSPTLFFTDLLLGGLFCCWGISCFHSKIAVPHFLGRKLVLFLVFVLGNIAFAHSPILAFVSWIRWSALLLFGLYIYKTKPSLRTILLPLTLGALYSSILGTIQVIHSGSLGGVLWLFGERTFTLDTPGIARGALCFPFSLGNFLGSSVSCPTVLRAYATLPHPNVLGGFLALVLLLGIQHKNQFTIPIIYKRFFFLVCFLGLFFTFSRSAWMALGLGYLVYRFPRNKWVWSGSILFFISASILFHTPLLSSMTSPFESIRVRQELSGASYQIITSHPVFGVGLNNFLPALPQYLPIRTIYFLQPVHNILLLFLSETGVVGIGLFAFFVLSQRKKLENPGLLGCLLVLGFFDHYLLTTHQGQLFFTLFVSLLFV